MDTNTDSSEKKAQVLEFCESAQAFHVHEAEEFEAIEGWEVISMQWDDEKDAIFNAALDYEVYLEKGRSLTVEDVRIIAARSEMRASGKYH